MIKNMQHAYSQHQIKFFAFIEPIRGKSLKSGNTRVESHNFYVFDEDGDCWCCLQHVDIKYVMNQLGGGFFKTRVVYTIDTKVDAFRRPIAESDEWIQGSFDKGYAVETIRESLGLDFQYLTALIKE